MGEGGGEWFWLVLLAIPVHLLLAQMMTGIRPFIHCSQAYLHRFLILVQKLGDIFADLKGCVVHMSLHVHQSIYKFYKVTNPFVENN